MKKCIVVAFVALLWSASAEAQSCIAAVTIEKPRKTS